jgi:hypothetical protein
MKTLIEGDYIVSNQNVTYTSICKRAGVEPVSGINLIRYRYLVFHSGHLYYSETPGNREIKPQDMVDGLGALKRIKKIAIGKEIDELKSMNRILEDRKNKILQMIKNHVLGKYLQIVFDSDGNALLINGVNCIQLSKAMKKINDGEIIDLN